MSKQEILISIKFTEDVNFGKGDVRQYSDTLFYTQEEFNKLSQKDIAAEKQRRVDAWKNVVSNPSPIAAPTKEEYASILANEEKRVSDLKAIMTAKGFLSVADERMVM